jgi:hypothetical protein
MEMLKRSTKFNGQWQTDIQLITQSDDVHLYALDLN